MTVREYTDKFKDLYQYAKNIYPTEEMRSEKFRDGLHVSLYEKLDLYAGITFRGWIEKAMEQERLNSELKEVEQRKESNQ